MLISVLQEHRGLLTIRYPMEHGIVRDWDDMERIWQYIYSKDQLQTFSEEVRMVVIVGQSVLNSSLRHMNIINSACWVLFHAFVVVC